MTLLHLHQYAEVVIPRRCVHAASHSWSPFLQGHAPSWSASSCVHFPSVWLLLCVQLQQVFVRLLPWPLLFCVPFLDNLGSPCQPPHSQDCWAVWKLPWPSTSPTGTSVPADPVDQCACHLLPRPIHQVSSTGSLFFFSVVSLAHVFNPLSPSVLVILPYNSLRSDLFSDPICHELRPLSPCAWIAASAPAWSPCPCLSSFSASWGHYPKRQICCRLSALKHVHWLPLVLECPSPSEPVVWAFLVRVLAHPTSYFSHTYHPEPVTAALHLPCPSW